MSATPDELLHQAKLTALDYMEHAVMQIDKKFGEGFSKEHPELVAGYMTTCATDFNTAIMAQTIDYLRGNWGYRFDALLKVLEENYE